jgi:hypothetical protein
VVQIHSLLFNLRDNQEGYNMNGNKKYIQEIKEIFLEVLENPKHKEVICLVLEGMNNIEIGKRLGISRERVRQLVISAITNLRLNLVQIGDYQGLKREFEEYKKLQEEKYNTLELQYQHKYRSLCKKVTKKTIKMKSGLSISEEIIAGIKI